MISPPFTVGAAGWISEARALHSPNFDARPDNLAPMLIVIHSISLPPGEFGGNAVAELFQNCLDCSTHPYYDSYLRGLRVSSHFLIRRDGALEQFVSCDARAWHAGVSNFLGRERCNDFSIGIELEGSDDIAFEATQYATLTGLARALLAHYPIDAFAGHCDIAPGRKTDPGPHFDWQRLQRDIPLAQRYFPYQAY